MEDFSVLLNNPTLLLHRRRASNRPVPTASRFSGPGSGTGEGVAERYVYVINPFRLARVCRATDEEPVVVRLNSVLVDTGRLKFPTPMNVFNELVKVWAANPLATIRDELVKPPCCGARPLKAILIVNSELVLT